MSDVNTTPIERDALANGFTKNAESGLYERDNGDGTKLVLNLWSGDLAGLGYITRDAIGEDQNALEAIVAAWGVAGVVNLATTAAANAQRNKARNSGLPKEISAEFVAKKAVADPLVFTTQDALNWKPGQRELSVAGLQKQFKEILQRAKAATDPSVKRELVQEASKIQLAINELQLKQLADLDNE